MTLVIAYWCIVAGSCAYVGRFGETAERCCVAAVTIASLLSVELVSPLAHRHQRLEWGVFAVDACLLAVLVAITIKSRKYWPLWATGFQTVDIVTNTALLSGVSARAYALALGFWAYAILACTWIGTARARSDRHRAAA